MRLKLLNTTLLILALLGCTASAFADDSVILTIINKKTTKLIDNSKIFVKINLPESTSDPDKECLAMPLTVPGDATHDSVTVQVHRSQLKQEPDCQNTQAFKVYAAGYYKQKYDYSSNANVGQTCTAAHGISLRMLFSCE